MRKFKQYSISEFIKFIESISVKRKINHIQIHHTWRPRKTDYAGERTIYGMWNYHVNTNGWQDIGQHFSIAPDGSIWDGRSLELQPAGISGHNSGGLMFEIIGDFDIGQESLEGIQLEAVIQAVRVCMRKFGLTEKAIVFHREHAAKTCPGSGITKEWFLQMIREPIKKDDIAGHWAEKEIRKVLAEGKMQGFPDGSFRPDEPLTRAQLAYLIAKGVI